MLIFKESAPALMLLSLLIFLGSGCEETELKESLPQDNPHITLIKFSLTETKNAQKLWTLNAALANVYDDLIMVDTVQIRFFDEKQEEHATLHSLKGTLNTKTHNIIVRDSVNLFTSDSVLLYTDSLFWQNDSQKILTDARVRITKQDGTVIAGKGLKTAPDLKRIEVLGAIAGESPIEFPKIR